MAPLRPPLLVLVALLLAGCASGPASDPEPVPGPVSFRDVHALAVHPQDPGTVFVATHHGLFRGGEGGFVRVGRGQDDLMGFTLHPSNANVAWSSGHPAAGTEGPGAWGARISLDGGASWGLTALRDVDLHAMTVSPADASRLWAFGSGKIYRSDDGGQTWRVVADGVRVISLAAHPKERDTVLAGGAVNVLRSVDGGFAWETLAPGVPALGMALAPDGGTVVAATGRTILRSEDGGRTWANTTFESPGGRIAHVAVSASDPRVAWAATNEGALFKSEDGARSWRLVKSAG